MATVARPIQEEQVEGMGIFDLLYLAWLDFLHIIQQLKFGIFLLMVIAVLTLIGASVPQTVFGDTPEDFLTYYSPTTYRWILALGFDRIFHTGYFLSLLGLLVVSVTLCAFGRLTAARKLAANTKPHTSIHEL
ncbi:MAG TPA: cytochrome c biogenesis protein ResB, partial [bacterium]|nr:cytochrome c biogenesis protein ResB [bacterium]